MSLSFMILSLRMELTCNCCSMLLFLLEAALVVISGIELMRLWPLLWRWAKLADSLMR